MSKILSGSKHLAGTLYWSILSHPGHEEYFNQGRRKVDRKKEFTFLLRRIRGRNAPILTGILLSHKQNRALFIGLSSVQIQPQLDFLWTHELVCCYYYGPEVVHTCME